MTVKREQTELFDAPLSRVAQAVRTVLERGQANYRYRETAIIGDGMKIETKIVPLHPRFLSTKMVIELNSEGSHGRISIQTHSQWYIMGDIFDMYRGYIRDLLWSVRQELSRPA
jgi:hypothetical protein